MSKAKLLIVDDDPKIQKLMKQFLEQKEFTIFLAKDGPEMMSRLSEQSIDLIILDLMLPGDDGLTLCENLRLSGDQVPILMLTAIGEDEQRLKGFAVGADDYLTKPFNPDELLARIYAILRRVRLTQENPVYTKLFFAGWTLDKIKRCLCSPHHVEVSLTDGEFRLLEALAERAPEVVSRDELLEIVEGRSAGPFDRSIDVRISRIRQKLDENPKKPMLIKTIRAGGYLLSAEVIRQF
jgi:two-component system, OmpR family, response regulator